MGCNANMPAGVIATCGANFEKVKNIFILKTGTKFDTLAKVKSQAEWIKAFREDLSAWGGKVVNSYEVTTDDKNIVTFDSTKKRSTNRPIPSGMFMLDTNFCDTKMLLDVLKNSNNEVVFQLEDDAIHMTQTIDGKFKGFLGTLDLVTKGLSQSADVGNNAPMTFFGDSYDEFANGALIALDFNLTSLAATYMPVGLNLAAAGTYNTTSGEVELNVNTRCSGGFEGLIIADVEILDTNDLSTPAVTTLTDNGSGSYTAVLQKDVVPVDLAVGDFMKIRIKKLNAAITEFVSNDLLISVNE